MRLANVHTRARWIDNVRILATLFVIGLHVSVYGIASEFNAVNGANIHWWICNFYESIFRCCVPLFVMLTGALLLPQTLSLKPFLTKRFGRILIPAVFWGTVYIIYNLIMANNKSVFSSYYDSFRWFRHQVLDGPISSFWYIYMLVGLYLFIPVLQPWVKSANNKALLYFLSIWLLTIVVKQWKLIPQQSPLELRYFSGYVGYLLSGYYLAHRLVITKKLYMFALVVSIIGFLVTLLGTYWASVYQRAFSGIFYEYLSLNVLALSAGVFILIKGQSENIEDYRPFWLKESIIKFGFGIYLIHPLPLKIMVYFGLNYKVINPLLAIPLLTLLCLTVSYLVAWLISKLPYGKYVTG
ncbi:acyltransferase family protein [Mucilaginibacter sp. CSA2-8R]|uniref:acyltransferase n=1 Tax=Mucilaginibacter sp. CSA2-8R TaxID=3141542 RepID=UPI00315CFD06